MTKLAVLAPASLFLSLASLSFASQGSLNNSGGSTAVGVSVSITSNVASPAGSLTVNCPITNATVCSGGDLTFLSTDGTASITGSFTSGKYVETCSGGGRGGRVTCTYKFTGYIYGTFNYNGSKQVINGVTYQSFGAGGKPAAGTTAYNSAYTPFYYSDSEQIHRSDDLLGTNQVSYGSQGSGPGQFYGSSGIAVDSKGRIYVADTYNCRVVRVDDMKGTNWISYGGTCGAGRGQFSDPDGVAVSSTGEIYIADSGNARIVRMDDMKGTNWVSYGSSGSGAGQFLYLNSLALDSLRRIYIADASNLRIVRMDDMNGTNWTVLSHSPVVNGVSFSFQSPVAVALDSAGKIYIADNESYQPAIIRVDDMTGTNWTSFHIGAAGPNSLSIDAGGTLFVGGGGVRLVDNMAGVLNSSGTIAPLGSAYVFGITALPVTNPPPPAITVSPAHLSFANQNVGTKSASQTVTITNFGGASLEFSGITTNNGFVETTDCSGGVVPGGSCTVSVSFAPTVSGAANGQLTLTDNSGNLGAKQVVTLSGLATVPAAGARVAQ